ncbi:SDR family oxidoreductase [Kitasatospora sp. NPDC018619]|uniref:SDR family oxidoreductase n=1 Tax=unclassified Kitasatospora TaxID=2633591 RepID=UPI0037B286A4
MTGATGSAGRHVVTSPVEAGHAVRALVRAPAKAALPVRPEAVGLVARHARRVVYPSTDLADLAEDEPPAVLHQEVERPIRHSALERAFVRATDFAGDLPAWADQVRQGVVRRPYGRARRALVRERDLAGVAVPALTEAGTPARGTCSPARSRSRTPSRPGSSAGSWASRCGGRSRIRGRPASGRRPPGGTPRSWRPGCAPGSRSPASRSG